MKAWFFAFAGLVTCATLTSRVALCQTALPDLKIYSMNDLGLPRPNGRISASFSYTGTTTVAADAVAYRGSVAAGSAAEVLRQSFTFSPGSFFTLDSGTTIPFNEGDVFTVCINPGRTVAESNYNNNCEERVVSAGYADLSINVTDITITPVGPMAG